MIDESFAKPKTSFAESTNPATSTHPTRASYLASNRLPSSNFHYPVQLQHPGLIQTTQAEDDETTAWRNGEGQVMHEGWVNGNRKHFMQMRRTRRATPSTNDTPGPARAHRSRQDGLGRGHGFHRDGKLPGSRPPLCSLAFPSPRTELNRAELLVR